jgi:Na+/H+ antiporter NhaD/arsenite permease-like protein
MKKNLLFIIPMIVIAGLLFMLRATGMKVHIAVSVVGLVLLASYTLATKKEWRNPGLEILQRVCYGIALITGVVLMNVHGIAAVSIIHKISAVLFVILLADVEIHKAIKK